MGYDSLDDKGPLAKLLVLVVEIGVVCLGMPFGVKTTLCNFQLVWHRKTETSEFLLQSYCVIKINT